MPSDDIFSRSYSSLSVKDLIEAREAYHVHLIKLDSVVGTAIGRFRIDRTDPCLANPNQPRLYAKDPPPRTLANTEVRPWSWPCVMVFVKTWYSGKELRKNPTQAVPRALYLPDGRVVPTCVLYAPPAPPDETAPERLGFPSETIGGGYPCFVRCQGRERTGTIGALVSREGSVYALTNRHVTGRDDQTIRAFVRGEPQDIGSSHAIHLGKKSFEDVYPGWPGRFAVVNLDAGLVLLDDLTDWTSQVFGIGEMGPVADMNVHTVSLDLIGTPVRAFGSASGPCEGEIQGLFYRYCTRAGMDYVADLLIGPRSASPAKAAGSGKKGSAPAREAPLAPKADAASPVPPPRLNVHMGDSGTILFVDPPRASESETAAGPRRGERARRLSPLAMLWGCVETESGTGPGTDRYALATFLSTICREMDVELVADWNTGYREYWGKSAHFKIGYKFPELLADPGLRALLLANRERIGFPNKTIGLGESFSIGRGRFVPLADVPDYVWVGMSRGDAVGGPRRNEPLQHFADIDEAAPGNGPCLKELCLKDRSHLSAAAWKEFYDGFSGQDAGPDPGTLPFRIRQVYEALAASASAGKLMDFVAGAGILAHYVADACISLHASKLNHGADAPPRRDKKRYADYKKTPAYKIHGLYEQRMFEVRAVELLDLIDRKLGDKRVPPTVRSGAQALGKAFDLMIASWAILPPEEIIAADIPGGSLRDRAEGLYDKLGAKAADCLALGCRTLADLVGSAWREGNGGRAAGNGREKPYREEQLQRLYRGASFLPALSLEEMIRKGY